MSNYGGFAIYDPSGNQLCFRGGSITVIDNGWKTRATGNKEYVRTMQLSLESCESAKAIAQGMFSGCSVQQRGNPVRHVWDGRRWHRKREEL